MLGEFDNGTSSQRATQSNFLGEFTQGNDPNLLRVAVGGNVVLSVRAHPDKGTSEDEPFVHRSGKQRHSCPVEWLSMMLRAKRGAKESE